MAKGKFLGFLGKVGNLAGAVIPGAGVAGKLAERASQIVKSKLKPAAEQKAAKEKKDEQGAKVVEARLRGSSETMAKLSVAAGNVWEFIKKYWWAFLPAALVGIYLIFFNKPRRVTRRRTTITRSAPARRKGTASKGTASKGTAWSRKMLLARRRKARKK